MECILRTWGHVHVQSTRYCVIAGLPADVYGTLGMISCSRETTAEYHGELVSCRETLPVHVVQVVCSMRKTPVQKLHPDGQ